MLEKSILDGNDTKTVNTLKAQLDEQTALVNNFNRQVITLESKISEAKTKKDLLNSSVATAQANEQLEQLQHRNRKQKSALVGCVTLC